VNPEVVGRNSVTGKINREYCKDMRLMENKCGSTGEHWEKKRSIFSRLNKKRLEVVKGLDERY